MRKVSHTFSALHTVLVPYLMWVKKEGCHQTVPVNVSGIRVLGEVPGLLRDGREIAIPEDVNNGDFQSLDQNSNEVPWDTPVEGLATSMVNHLIVRFVSSDTA